MMHKQHEIYMKYTWNIHGKCQKTQRHLYSTDWRRGLVSGVTNYTRRQGLRWLQDTNMLVSPMQKSDVGSIAQRHPPTPGILRSGGI